jgi:hypothetical protein
MLKHGMLLTHGAELSLIVGKLNEEEKYILQVITSKLPFKYDPVNKTGSFDATLVDLFRLTNVNMSELRDLLETLDEKEIIATEEYFDGGVYMLAVSLTANADQLDTLSAGAGDRIRIRAIKTIEHSIEDDGSDDSLGPR